MTDPRDDLDAWLESRVQPLPPPPGTSELIRRRARRRKVRRAAVAAAGAAAVVTLIAAVPTLIIPRLQVGHGQQQNSAANGSTLTTGPRSAAVDEIAGDSAKVSLAGAMLSQAASGSDVRFDKVAELRQSIEAGTYSVSSQDVATRLIDTLQK